MANPQKEQGSTMISNEVFEKIYSFPFSSGELRILLFIIRKTWGWHKKEDKISYNQIAKATNTTRRNAIYAINTLVKKQALVVKKGHINTISFNKDYEQWVVKKQALVKNSVLPSEETGTTLVKAPSPKLVKAPSPTKDNKDTITKETIQKIIPAKAGKNINHPYKKVILLCRKKQGIQQEYVNYAKQTTAVKKILSAGYKIEDINFVIEEMVNDPYWKDNPFDLMNVANQMHKYMNRIVYFSKGGEKNAKY